MLDLSRAPYRLASLKLAAALEIAEVFEDREAIERLGRAAAGGPRGLGWVVWRRRPLTSEP